MNIMIKGSLITIKLLLL